MRKILTVILLTLPAFTTAETPKLFRVQAHAGQMDTDGILSQGEVKNPNIDYDRAQRSAERRGDQRFDNPYNDSAANRERLLKDDANAYDWHRDRRDEYARYDRDDYDYYDDDAAPRWNW
jgi:hypothetical protein